MITTSRYASVNTRKLARSMAMKKHTIYVARGKKTIDQLAEQARRKGESEVAIIEEKKGAADSVSLIEVRETGEWRWVGKTGVKEYEKHD